MTLAIDPNENVNRVIDENVTAEKASVLIRRLASYIVLKEDGDHSSADDALTMADWDFIADIRMAMFQDDDALDTALSSAAPGTTKIVRRSDGSIRVYDDVSFSRLGKEDIDTVYVDEGDNDDDVVTTAPTHWHVYAAFGASIPENDDAYETYGDAIGEMWSLAKGYYGENTHVDEVQPGILFAKPSEDAMGGINIWVSPCTNADCDV